MKMTRMHVMWEHAQLHTNSLEQDLGRGEIGDCEWNGIVFVIVIVSWGSADSR